MNSCESTPVATPLFAEQKLGDNVQRDRAVLHAAGFRNQASDHDAYAVCEKRILVPGKIQRSCSHGFQQWNVRSGVNGTQYPGLAVAKQYVSPIEVAGVKCGVALDIDNVSQLCGVRLWCAIPRNSIEAREVNRSVSDTAVARLPAGGWYC
jgi:hypothetical protein